MVGIRPLSLAILMLALLPASAASNPTTQIIVKRAPGLTAAERADIRADAGVQLVETLSIPRIEVVAAKPGDVADALNDLTADPDVVYAERDAVVRAFAPDEYIDYLWAFENTGQPLFPGEPDDGAGTADADGDVVEAWALRDSSANPITGLGQEVAVVDSGVDDTHPDLAANVVQSVNFIDDGLDGSDLNGHGTHVTGTIAALRDNGEGVAGVAPAAKIRSLRVLGANGTGSMSDVADAFNYAGSLGVPIVNASLGSSSPSQAVLEAIRTHHQTLFVVAAGNDGRNNDDVPTYPCNTPEENVVCVGASTNDDLRRTSSNYGARAVDVFSPGQDILSTIPVDDEDPAALPYEFFSGTSMASPLVAGIAALVLQASPGLTPVDVKQTIMASGDPLSDFNGRSISGRRANAEQAVENVLAPPVLADADGDGWFDAADACPNSAFSPAISPDGCERDDDWDKVADSVDNCPPPTRNPLQTDTDRDGVGDACDTDDDNDTVLDASDRCRLTPGPASNAGCPVTTVTPPSPGPTAPAPPANQDGDGHPDSSDSCPTEYAITGNGCPLAQVASLSAKATKRGSKRSATIRVTASRLAMMRITVERKKGRRWVRVVRRTVSGTRGTLKVSRLKRGKHRVRVSISSSAGRGNSVSKTFRVR
jgi:subtilisin family serine protease